jgi:hypothetical protein
VNNRILTLTAIIILIGLLAALGGIKREPVADNGETAVAAAPLVAPVIYLIPADKEQVEDAIRPERLLAEATMEIGVTSDWEMVQQQAAVGDLQAVIIHHAALSSVNPDELRRMFLREGVTVIGLGIPGLTLAEAVGHSQLFSSNRSGRERYTTPLYFYAYSYSATNSSLTEHATTDSLLREDAIPLLLHVVRLHTAPKN